MQKLKKYDKIPDRAKRLKGGNAMETIRVDRETVVFIMNTKKGDEKQEYEKKIVEKVNKIEGVKLVLLKKERDLRYIKYHNVSFFLTPEEFFEILGENTGKKVIILYVEPVDQRDLENFNEEKLEEISEFVTIVPDYEILETDLQVV